MTDLTKWDVEDKDFWESSGKSVANRNLYVSILSLLCGFAVWLYWGIITVQMLNLGFPFSKSDLFTLSAIAGLTGATLRIPSTFFIRIAGGRNTIFFTTALLMIPAIGTGFALQDKETPLWVFQILALSSGFGGGNFASSMSNISYFFPKRVQGLALGLNAGLGNAGVTTMQIVVPLVMTFGMFGALSGDPMTLQSASGTLVGKIPAGSETWISNAGFVWLLLLLPLAIAGWFGMNNIRTDEVTPEIAGGTQGAFIRITVMLLVGFFTASVGLYFILPQPLGLGLPGWTKWFVLLGVIASTVALLYYVCFFVKDNLRRQYGIFRNKQTWVMSVIYTMTFGSFIGYSAAFPLAIKIIFGFQHLEVNGIITHDTINPNGPSALMYAWMGPFIGALIRPVGGWIADKVGGAKVTQVVTIVMIASALGVAYFMKLAYVSATPEEYFVPFFLLFMVLFAGTGIGNGSTFRTTAMIFPKEQAGPALGWTSAVAAYGAFIIPKVFGEQIKAATPEYALYGFAAFYAVCL
ncbi:MAG TPA: antiporter, partial [Alphaproteobacteria bacterium]|nr:antiporter [Alphaproteobacteria bacterium]